MTDTATVTETTLQGSYELLDPAKITVRNIRDAKPNPRLIQSIREHGVLQPIGVIRTPDGELMLGFGARRRQACIEIGCQVPAIVVDGTTGSDSDETERIFKQLDENDNREDLTAADRAVAVAALFDLGVTQRMITHKTGLGKDELAAARKVATSETARTLAAQYPLDLEQTAAIAEFEDDETTRKKLAETALETPGQFKHALQRARDARADRERIAAHAAKLAKQGITVTDDRPSYENLIDEWADADGKQLTPKTHKKCPGNVVVLRTGWNRNKVDESWYCTDTKGNGHKRYRASSNGGAAPTTEERRHVIDNNKAWRSAEKVRRTWLREFLARPKVPDGGLLFTLEAFARSDYKPLKYGMEHRMAGQHDTARALLGLPKDERGGYGRPPEVWTAITKASPARAQVIALGIVLGAYEGSTGVHCWRNPDTVTAEYLEALAGWGYALSDIEQELVAAAQRERETRDAAAAAAGEDEAAAAEPDYDYDEDDAGDDPEPPEED